MKEQTTTLIAWTTLIVVGGVCWLVHDVRLHPTPPDPCVSGVIDMRENAWALCPGGHFETVPENINLQRCICQEKNK
jgi:hypothetical protein